MIKTALILSLFMVQTFAFSSKDQKRLDFINEEIKKIKSRIKEGQDPALFEKYLTDFEKEKKILLSKKEEKKKVVKKEAKKAKKKEKKKKIITKKSKVRPLRVMSLNKNVSVEDVKAKLMSERERLLYLLRNNKSDRDVKQAQLNITYLENELSKRGNESKLRDKFNFDGHVQFRTETSNNRQATQGDRQSEDSFYRVRTNLRFKANDKLDFLLALQATKGFGVNESSSSTSGSLKSTEVDFYEANFKYKLASNLDFTLGRQALAYGDHLIIGSLPWANTARSFDAAKLRYKNKYGWLDVIYSQLSDNDTQRIATDDKDLVVVYNSMKFNDYLKVFDTYFIRQVDHRTSELKFNTVGIRAKGNFGSFFYRTENGIQKGANLGDDAHQYNIELGNKFFKKYSFSGEYSIAGKNYQQLFPTAHKFLGFADVLGRRNIKHFAFHFKAPILPWIALRADYHNFKRDDVTAPTYTLTGGARTTTGSSDDIGDEVDVVVTFKSKYSIKLQLGAAWFMPGQHMKDINDGDADTTNFYYAQINANF